MPRAGSGGRSSSHRSSGHRSAGGHSSSRSSGGHRIGSGSHSRAGSGHTSSYRSRSTSSYHGTSPLGGPGMPPPSRGYRHRSYRRTYYGGSMVGSLGSVITAVLILTMIFAFITVFISTGSSGSLGSSSIPASTRNREKLDSGLPFNSQCIVDELGWFDSVSSAGRKLKPFYDKTGVQPYIVLLKYRPELINDSQKEQYAQDYYEDNIDNEATFLYMYFAEEDQDNEVGFMCYVNGRRVDSVMDEEAIDIFWGYIDRNWETNMSTDQLFADTFEKTADAIMTKTKTAADIAFVLVIGVVIVAVIIAIIAAMNTRRKHERERAEETQRILNTPLPDNPLSSQGTQRNNTNQDQ